MRAQCAESIESRDRIAGPLLLPPAVQSSSMNRSAAGAPSRQFRFSNINETTFDRWTARASKTRRACTRHRRNTSQSFGSSPDFTSTSRHPMRSRIRMSACAFETSVLSRCSSEDGVSLAVDESPGSVRHRLSAEGPDRQRARGIQAAQRVRRRPCLVPAE